MQGLSEAERAQATGFFTAIRRGRNGSLSIVPYNVEYQNELTRIAALLREAAALSSEPTLKTFLTKRADALLSNDYYDSDVAWMELKGAVEPTIGPYEVYEDEFFNYKAAFESFITIQDEDESAKIQKFSGQLQEIENRLPIDPKYRNPKIAGMAPLVVVDEIFAAGDANRGVQTAAYNLPNDERVLKEKGAKRVMLKNVQDAKFAKTLVPISKVVLDTADQRSIAFDAFFSQIVVHEMMHGLGPHNITVNGRETTVRKEMKEASSFLEEAKADISSLYALQFMIDKGVLPKTLQDTLYTTFLASCFRSIRFGIAEAHGKGIAVQLNYLLDQGGFVVKPDGTFAVNQRQDQGRRDRSDARHHDDSGRRQLSEGQGTRRSSRRRSAAGPEAARQAERRAGRHRAALHDGGEIAARAKAVASRERQVAQTDDSRLATRD